MKLTNPTDDKSVRFFGGGINPFKVTHIVIAAPDADITNQL